MPQSQSVNGSHTWCVLSLLGRIVDLQHGTCIVSSSERGTCSLLSSERLYLLFLLPPVLFLRLYLAVSRHALQDAPTPHCRIALSLQSRPRQHHSRLSVSSPACPSLFLCTIGNNLIHVFKSQDDAKGRQAGMNVLPLKAGVAVRQA